MGRLTAGLLLILAGPFPTARAEVGAAVGSGSFRPDATPGETISVARYGASGSGESTTGSIAAGATSLLVASPVDFAVGQGIRIKGAGGVFSVPRASRVEVVQAGAKGSTRYEYKISMMGCDGGLGLPAVAATREGNQQLSTADHITIALEPGTGHCGYAVWRSADGSAFVYAGVGDGSRWTDTGWAPPWRPENIDPQPPSALRHRDLVTTITAIVGSTITLAAPATNAVTSAVVLHDDTSAIQRAVDHASRNAVGARAVPGGEVRIPCGQYNLSATIVVSTGGVSLVGSGPCTKLQAYGGFDDFAFLGPSPQRFMFGNRLTDFYHPAYNKYNGVSLRVRFAQTFEASRIFTDHPWAGQHFHDVNDIRLSAIRLNRVWGDGVASLRIESGKGAEEYACCFDIRDWYANNLSTDKALNGGRQNAAGIVLDGNVATIIASNMAISNIEGTGLRIENAVGHPTGKPSFVQLKDFSSEFSNSEAVSITAGQEIFFTDSILHGARNDRSNLVVGEGVRVLNWTGGRIGNAGCHNVVLRGSSIRLQGAAIINASAPNSGGRSGNCHGVLLDRSARNVAITGNFIGREYGATWQGARPVYVVSGADRFAITGNTFDGNSVDAVDMTNAGYASTRVERGNVGTSAPSIKSGFGNAAAIVGADGPYAFRLEVGTGGTASQGVITLPVASVGWGCNALGFAPAPGADVVTRSRPLNRTDVELRSYSSAGVPRPWPPNETLALTCLPY